MFSKSGVRLSEFGDSFREGLRNGEFARFCAMTCLDPATTQGERETLRIAEWELYDFVFGDNVFRNDEKSVMRWFDQWMYDVNYAALTEG